MSKGHGCMIQYVILKNKGILTDEDLENEIAQNNNSLLTFRKKVFSRSNISLFFLFG